MRHHQYIKADDEIERLRNENSELWGVLNAVRVILKMGSNPAMDLVELLPRIEQVLEAAEKEAS
jgi:hypothetical protein